MFDPHSIGPRSSSFRSRNRGRVIQRRLVDPPPRQMTRDDLIKLLPLYEQNNLLPTPKFTLIGLLYTDSINSISVKFSNFVYRSTPQQFNADPQLNQRQFLIYYFLNDDDIELHIHLFDYSNSTVLGTPADSYIYSGTIDNPGTNPGFYIYIYNSDEQGLIACGLPYDYTILLSKEYFQI